MTLPLSPPPRSSLFSVQFSRRGSDFSSRWRRGRAGRGKGWVATAEQYLSLVRDQFSRVGHTGRFEWVFHLTFFIFDFLPFDVYLIDFLRF